VVKFLEDALEKIVVYREVFERNRQSEVKKGAEGVVFLAKHRPSGNSVRAATLYHGMIDFVFYVHRALPPHPPPFYPLTGPSPSASNALSVRVSSQSHSLVC
jgi:hypothetical protein